MFVTLLESDWSATLSSVEILKCGEFRLGAWHPPGE